MIASHPHLQTNGLDDEDEGDDNIEENKSMLADRYQSLSVGSRTPTPTSSEEDDNRRKGNNCIITNQYNTASIPTNITEENISVQKDDTKDMIYHDGKNFVCKHCNKVYASLGALKMHIRTHTLPCKCKICGKAFSRPWLLQGHIRTHTGEKPFGCEKCNRSFADRSNLRAHMQTHAEIKKYSCYKCRRTFSRWSSLKKHENSSNCQEIKIIRCNNTLS
ncbi:Zinc finger protein SNAI2 [Trichoplax sp. H2]|nr:Zinc finger protein SNAI2 [Trichoplax sp. H2]|eukprot:RDD47197.1 Zinc finger protein SNAI2 [Trichoplax sp. H2]